MSTLQPTDTESQAPPDSFLLDLFSTSQSLEKKCHKNAPYICIPPRDGQPGRLYQSCCNDWLCPRCGQLRAKHEYGRMVVGARQLGQDHKLYMMTVTLPGDIDIETGDAEYLERTNRLHANINYRARTDKIAWHYAAVTERQRRGHAHSHYITTFCPPDAYYIVDDYERYCHDVQHINAKIPENMRYSPESLKDIDLRQMFSVWLSLASVKAGMGVQCRMAVADIVEGASRYMAAYLFKVSIFQQWPEGWRRIRYSQNWPKLPEIGTTDAFPVLKAQDWQSVANLAGTIETYNSAVYEKALRWQCSNVICKVDNEIDL